MTTSSDTNLDPLPPDPLLNLWKPTILLFLFLLLPLLFLLLPGGFVTRQEAIHWCHDLAKRTFGWTGADLSGMMRNAASYAIDRSLSMAKIPSSTTTTTTTSNSDFNAAGGGGSGVGSLLTIGDVKITWGDVHQAYVESSRR